MIFAVTLEQMMVVFFAGGPGLAALIMQVVKHRSEKPEREANLAQTLTSTAGSLLDRMQTEIDELRKELRVAEDKIIELGAKLEASQDLIAEAARERERCATLELEIARLKAFKEGVASERKDHEVLEEGEPDG